MARKSKEYLESLKSKHKVDEIWSWSKYNSYKTDPYGYLLKYILKKPESRSSIYGISGGYAHDIVEGYYNGSLKYEQMLPKYEEKLFEMNMADLKYNRSDEVANKKIADKYEDNVREFFKNHIPIKNKCILEQFITIKVGNYLFQGYIDCVYKDDLGKYNIVDWKTSTMYVGKKVLKERGQLVLYAESLIQKGIKLEDINIKWNFLKYCSVEQTLLTIDKETKLHKTRVKNCLRNEWVKSVESTIRKWINKLDYDELQIEDMVSMAIENNNLDNMPEEVKNKFKLSDCYVDIPLDQDAIDDLKSDIMDTLGEIKEKEKEYDKTKDDNLFWVEIDKTNEFYFSNLCSYSVKEHRPYKEYLDDLNIFKNDYSKSNDSDSWIDDL